MNIERLPQTHSCIIDTILLLIIALKIIFLFCNPKDDNLELIHHSQIQNEFAFTKQIKNVFMI